MAPGLAPKVLRANFERLPEPWERMRSTVIIYYLGLTPQGSASIFMADSSDKVERFVSAVQGESYAVRARKTQSGPAPVRLTARHAIAGQSPRMSAQDYRSVVETFAKGLGDLIRHPNIDVSDDATNLSEREWESYDVERLFALVSFADKNCVADGVLLVTDNQNLAGFKMPQDIIRQLAVRALASEAQEIAHHGHRDSPRARTFAGP